ncbi:MAG TPA: aminotransferase class I/II-fold pyridoxal phosphate-dependent enzyme [Rickettsiales bacterium]|nr:aminotransferase class I/II-fold pyridoxal phosphate-dependent enzyme [Rickettsiales bacterium]
MSFSKYLRTVEKSQTLLLNEQSRNLEQGGKKVYKFGFGQSPFLPPQHVIDLLKENAHRKDYSPVQGIPALREAVAEFHRKVDGIDARAENVLIAPGSKILIYAVLAAFTRADLLVCAPAWVSYVPQAHLLGHGVISIPTTFEKRWRLTAEGLEAAVAQKKDKDVPSVLILNYPGNPDGLSYTDAELKAIGEVARKHNVLVISDEIYGVLHHTGGHVSLAKHYPEGTIVTGGLSKWCGAGGWRLGTAVLPVALGGEFKDTMLGIASETYSCATLPVQLAACEAYKASPETMEYVKQQRRILAALGAHCVERLQASGVRVDKPEGAFYLFPDFSAVADKLVSAGITTSQALCESLLADTGVALLPGTAFGMPAKLLAARLAYVDFDGVAVLAAAQKADVIDTAFLRKHCAHQLEGIEMLCNWVDAFNSERRVA